METKELIEWLKAWTSPDNGIIRETRVRNEIIKRLKHFDRLVGEGEKRSIK